MTELHDPLLGRDPQFGKRCISISHDALISLRQWSRLWNCSIGVILKELV